MMNDISNDQKNRPVLLCILDGWGYREDATDNAIALGNTPNWDAMVASRPMSLLGTSGEDVGLPEGQMGNSEVGHMTIGSGRVILQDLPRINSEIHTGTLGKNERLLEMIGKLKASGGTCHLSGLLSPGGVHSHQNHTIALARIFQEAGIPTKIHAILDGRDTPPSSGLEFIKDVETELGSLDLVEIATLCGRYFAMDRDKNWDRVEKSWNALFHGTGTVMTSSVDAIEAAYAKGETDEFMTPHIREGYKGIQDGDAFLMTNFRADRARQFLDALTDETFTGFDKGAMPKLVAIVGMVEYSAQLASRIPALFPPVEVKQTLGEVVSKSGRTQLRIAETEKYAHVTFFLNGGEEQVYQGEERILIPSPKVATYDLQPEMSAPEVEAKLISAITDETFDLIVVNFANPDMVGHSGVLSAAIKAVETMDGCIGRLAEAVEKVGGVMLITADHGNIELMRDQTSHEPHTAHTTNLVPFVLAVGEAESKLQNGTLADVAPTVLSFMGLSVPEEMTGRNLAETNDEKQENRAAS
ncbi:2,3-bisphosphoglycerate-independent phosphoglycerate mutase [Sneathiella sp.]|jgi:2,3-bisphosphoglycerate-independent phosphoglycerate mutase|uniref:2,3-bisphosphoglycerate-independent phosphoglycerate mutase n=1 Tax=Sneathiella sp. TaxID=1964365 RepID=UPI0039E5DA95